MTAVDDGVPLIRRSATLLARQIATGQVSSREVVTAFLDRIDAVNPTYNAIVSMRSRSDILAEADSADAAARRQPRLGALHGLPIAIKDLAATKGLRTTQGSPLADTVPPSDALFVHRMREAGAIIIGKTNVPEFGLGSHTTNPVFGPTRNAFDVTRSAGGSSGGTAVALALDMLPVADGSDFGGSLRNPAAWNNVFGLRPSQGRVPALAAPDAFFSQLATDGPMARHVEDLALLLSVQAGWDVRAPLSLPDPGYRFEERLTPAAPARIGWLGDLGGHLSFEDGIMAVCSTALDRLARLGHTIESILPAFDYEALWRAFVVLRQVSVGGRLMPFYEDTARLALLKPEAQWECEGYLGLSARDVFEASCVRTAWFGCLVEVFDQVDYLALPAAQVWPFPVAWRWPRTIEGRTMDTYHRWMEVVAPITLSGCPAVSLPAGFGGPGGHLPMGLQIVGRPRDDRGVLRLALGYEHANPWIAEARHPAG
jgi:amidase